MILPAENRVENQSFNTDQYSRLRTICLTEVAPAECPQLWIFQRLALEGWYETNKNRALDDFGWAM